MFFQWLMATDQSLFLFAEQQRSISVIRQNGELIRMFNSLLNDSFTLLSRYTNTPIKEQEEFTDFLTGETHSDDNFKEHMALLTQRETEGTELLRRLNIFFQHLPKDTSSEDQKNLTLAIDKLQSAKFCTEFMMKGWALDRP